MRGLSNDTNADDVEWPWWWRDDDDDNDDQVIKMN